MKTWALFVDAYRELNSKKLFWITMILSGLVVAIFGAIGLNENGIAVLWYTIPNEFVNSQAIEPAVFYMGAFTRFGVRFWLSIIATVLALITTAGMIPDFISGGSIELMLSKPISRVRLYLTKFFTGLLFVGLQVTVFCVASILVIGLRGGVWEPGILLAVPIVVLFYSYLFSICTLIGLLTRSTLASLLLTVLLWFMLFLLNTADGILLNESVRNQTVADQRTARVQVQQERLESLWANTHGGGVPADPDGSGTHDQEDDPDSTEASATGFGGVLAGEVRRGPRVEDLDEEETLQQIERTRGEIESLRESVDSAQRTADTVSRLHQRVLVVKTILPKTRDTIDLLNRHLISQEDVEQSSRRQQERFGEEFSETNRRTQEAIRSRSLWWIVGTSLIFEAFILGLGAWIFSRRDF